MNNAMKRKYAPENMTSKHPLMMAGGVCALLANPAMAVELGDIQMQSALGQPLRASIAFALAPNEQISDQCIYIRSAGPVQGLPSINRASSTISGNRILLRGTTPLREPMMSLQVAVNCPYTAKVQREYLLMLNPPSLQEEAASEPVASVESSRPAQPVAATPRPAARRPVNTFEPAPRAATRPAASTAPIESGSSYRVQVGDTLSEIASRIPNRTMNLWGTVDSIFAANPDAFLNQDVDRLVAGSVLKIPSAVTGGNAVDTPAAVTPAAAAPAADNQRLGYGGPATSAAESSSPDAVESSPVEPATAAPAAAEPAAADPVTATNEPATAAEVEAFVEPAVATDIPQGPFVEEPGTLSPAPEPQATVSIPNTRIPQAQPEPLPLPPIENESAGSSWLVWLGGAGIAIFLALLLFGRRLREIFGGSDNAAELYESQMQDANPNHEATAKLNLTETIGKANAMIVEEDLTTGNVFDTGHDLDVNLDYSFASTGEHDKNELDFVVESADSEANTETQSTEILPVEPSEVPAQNEEDSYSMSMVLDVTKQNFQIPGGAKDLRATQIEPVSELAGDSNSLDMTSELDLRILEQDYEDELTAQMALSDDAVEAARDLKEHGIDISLDAHGDAMTVDFDITDVGTADDASDDSMAVDLDATAEITAEMPAAAMDDDPMLDDATMIAVDENEDETDLTEALAASLASLENEIGDDDQTEVLDLELESTVNQHKSKVG